MNRAQMPGESVAALDMFIGFQSAFPTPPSHVLNQLLLAPSEIRFALRRALDLAERVGDEPVPAEVRVRIDPTGLQGRLPVVVPKEPGRQGRSPDGQKDPGRSKTFRIASLNEGEIPESDGLFRISSAAIYRIIEIPSVQFRRRTGNDDCFDAATVAPLIPRQKPVGKTA